MSANLEAQVSQNNLKSIANRTNINELTTARISVGGDPSFIRGSGYAIYVANEDSGTVSVINPDNNTVIKTITVGEGPTFIQSLEGAIYVANQE